MSPKEGVSVGSSHSTFLLADPSFVAGLGRLGDIWGGLSYWSYNSSKSPAEADYRALSHDWNQVGDDLETAMANSPDK